MAPTRVFSPLPPRLVELLLLLFLGGLQPVLELAFGTRIAAWGNVAASLLVLAYIAYRAKTVPGIWKAWGVRLDTFRSSFPAYLVVTVCGAVLVYLLGMHLGNAPLPASFWYLLALYPVWGFAQQFALQNFVANNLRGILRNELLRALVTALFFGLAHLPSLSLFLLASSIGFVFTLLYPRAPNMLALGIAHGILGALVFYLALGQNQWEVLRGYMG